MAVVADGKPAVTHYRIAHRFKHYTKLQVNLETGRTHQIRVHMAHRKWPLIGDPVYGGRQRVPAGASDFLMSTLRVSLAESTPKHWNSSIPPVEAG